MEEKEWANMTNLLARDTLGRNAYVMLKPIGKLAAFARSCIYDLHTDLYEGDNCLDNADPKYQIATIETPVLISSEDNPCGDADLCITGRYQLNPISRSLFNKEVDHAFTIAESPYIGEIVENSQYIQARLQPAELFKLDVPLIGKSAIQQALEQGIIRSANEDVFKAWLKASEQYFPDSLKPRMNTFLSSNSYVILKPFQIPRGVNNATFFVIPSGVPRPKDRISGAIGLLDVNAGSCVGYGCPKKFLILTSNIDKNKNLVGSF